MIARLRFASTRTQQSVKRQDHDHSVEVKRKCYETVSRVTSTTMNNERDQFSHLEPLAVGNGDEHGVADFLVHDLASAVKQDHNYSFVNFSVGTQTFLSSDDLDEQNQEIKRLNG